MNQPLNYHAPHGADADQRSAARRYGVLFTLIILAFVGALCDMISTRGRDQAWLLTTRWGPIMLAAILAAIPEVRAGVWGLLERIREPGARARRKATVAIALAATIYLFFTATWQGRDMTAKEQDENMYLVQTQMLARGRLWMPQHPHADFFESFHVMVKPVYAGIYFPGTALAYVPSVWLRLPPWVFSLLIAGAGVGMMYRVVTELIDGVAGALGALLLLASVEFRHLSTMVMSHTLMLLLGLLMAWAYLRWRRERRVGWAIICGGFAGWAAITRPVDAIAYAAPLLIAVMWDLGRARWGERLITCVVAVAAALPFVALQLVLDYGVTGRLLRTPVDAYHATYWPQAAIGFGGKTIDARLPTDKPQFQQYYDDYIMPAYKQYSQTSPAKLLATVRLPMVANVALPSMILLALAPLAVLELRGRPGRWQLVLALPLFLVGYATFVFFRKQYAAVILPPALLCVLLGARAVEATFPRWQVGWGVFATIALAGLALADLPELNPKVRDQQNPTPILHAFEEELRKLGTQRALVMVRHPAGEKVPRHEPVYNNRVAWPDDATVVRAHDLGWRNTELYRYYAQIQPERQVYLFDKATRKMTPLGKVTDLAH